MEALAELFPQADLFAGRRSVNPGADSAREKVADLVPAASSGRDEISSPPLFLQPLALEQFDLSRVTDLVIKLGVWPRQGR